MEGIRPISLALIALAVLSLTNGDNFIDYLSPVLFVGSIICSVRFGLHPIVILAGAALVGLLVY